MGQKITSVIKIKENQKRSQLKVNEEQSNLEKLTFLKSEAFVSEIEMIKLIILFLRLKKMKEKINSMKNELFC